MPVEYAFELPLESGADLRILNFSHEDHSWIFKYRHFSALGEEEVLNNYTCSLRYKDGVVYELSLMMDIVFPERRGKRYCYGVDISENSRLTLTFNYDKVDADAPYFKLGEVIAGCSKRLDLRSIKDGTLMQTIDFPFEVCDELRLDCGQFQVPFMTCDGATEYFRFSNSVRRELRKV